MTDKLVKVERIKHARQERVGQFLAAARERLRIAEQQQDDIEELCDEYGKRLTPEEAVSMSNLLMGKRFHDQLSDAAVAQAGTVHEAEANMQSVLVDYARRRQETELLRDLIQKRERLHKRQVLKKLQRAQMPKATTKL